MDLSFRERHADLFGWHLLELKLFGMLKQLYSIEGSKHSGLPRQRFKTFSCRPAFLRKKSRELKLCRLGSSSFASQEARFLAAFSRCGSISQAAETGEGRQAHSLQLAQGGSCVSRGLSASDH
jgi:hypothetical protein